MVFISLVPAGIYQVWASITRGQKKKKKPRKIEKEQKRGIPLRAKIIALTFLWVSILYSVHTVKPVVLKGMLLAIATAVSVYLVRTKTLRRDPVKEQDS